jgi:protocatechuate 3,4-dioxygenase beta subunit
MLRELLGGSQGLLGFACETGGVSDLERLSEGLPLSRRRALAVFGGLGLAAVLPGCADDDPAATPATSAPQGSADCVLMPELTEGPYYLDLDLVRHDITEGRPGLPLELAVGVVDAESCDPVEGAAVDVWHCDAEGAYSGVEGDAGTFLRGVQVTGADGVAAFRTILPGWYAGRAVHVHLKVALGTTDVHTGQLFFDEATIAAAYESAPYTARGAPDTSNEADGIFGQSGGTTVVAVTPGETYRGTVTLGVQRA